VDSSACDSHELFHVEHASQEDTHEIGR